MRNGIRAVVFDLGGVIVDSPFVAIARHEALHNLPAGLLNRVFAGGENCAFARLERGEISVEKFYAPFAEEAKARTGVDVDAKALFSSMNDLQPRPPMIAAIKRLREAGLKTGAITNNWWSEKQSAIDTREIKGLFDVFTESCVVGVRKPDPRIFEMTLKQLGEPAEAVVFLDDIGRNLKGAKALGMSTILVKDPYTDALDALQQLVGVPLLDPVAKL